MFFFPCKIGASQEITATTKPKGLCLPPFSLLASSRRVDQRAGEKGGALCCEINRNEEHPSMTLAVPQWQQHKGSRTNNAKAANADGFRYLFCGLRFLSFSLRVFSGVACRLYRKQSSQIKLVDFPPGVVLLSPLPLPRPKRAQARLYAANGPTGQGTRIHPKKAVWTPRTQPTPTHPDASLLSTLPLLRQ